MSDPKREQPQFRPAPPLGKAISAGNSLYKDLVVFASGFILAICLLWFLIFPYQQARIILACVRNNIAQVGQCEQIIQGSYDDPNEK